MSLSSSLNKEVLVVAAIFTRGHEALLFQRGATETGAHQWEFPGGKVDAGESEVQALVREIREELEIAITVQEFVAESLYQYPNKLIRLRAFFVEGATEQIKLVEHQAMQWVAVERLLEFDLALADIPIAMKLKSLPRWQLGK